MSHDTTMNKRGTANRLFTRFVFGLTSLLLLAIAPIEAQKTAARVHSWNEPSLPPETRASLVLKEMTLDEKVLLLHGLHWAAAKRPSYVTSGAVGYVYGVPRLGIPALQIADAALGITKGALSARYSTPLPSALCEAAAWDTELSFEKGQLLGRELRDAGFNMSLAGGVNITRDPRNGRSFEYLGEDPVLAGTLVGAAGRGVQSQGVIGDIKHFAVNDQETDRTTVNVVMDRRTLRETDVLAFEIGLRNSGVNSVMCAYNKFNGDHACESAELLHDVLKHDLNFAGFVISDWEATHSTAKAANAGLDMQMPDDTFFGDSLKHAVLNGEVSQIRLDDMVHRVLSAEFAAGLFDRTPATRVPDVDAGMATAQRIAEQGAVLLKNQSSQLPLSTTVRSILIVGGHADVGVITGGGSSKVDPPGGSAIPAPTESSPIYFRSSPLKELQLRLPYTSITFDAGDDPKRAAQLARQADIAIVFAVQYSQEDRDLANLSLPDGQDALISAIAAANLHTVVVLETGSPVLMPWLDRVSAVLETWYPGVHGGQAIANLLSGSVSPSGKLPITFPASESQLPHATPFDSPKDAPLADYTEGLKVGYKWYESEKKTPLFPFGFGLSYTTFAYSGQTASWNNSHLRVRFTVKNIGKVAGTEIAQVYASLPTGTGEPPQRLVGWQRVKLSPGQAQDVDLTIDPLLLSVFDVAQNNWKLTPGQYIVRAGGSSQNLPLLTQVKIP